nr:unnamed protein product [Callosobruchus analis]
MLAVYIQKQHYLIRSLWCVTED